MKGSTACVGEAEPGLVEVARDQRQRAGLLLGLGHQRRNRVFAALLGPASKHEGHLHAAGEQPLCEGAADQTGATGHERVLRLAHPNRE